MGFISNLAASAALALGLGKHAEASEIATTLREAQPDTIIADDVETQHIIKWGRSERRRHQRTLKARDRNTKFSKRSKVFSAKRLHDDANNKVLNYINHTLLHKLFSRANLFQKEQA